ncbi:MAG TPA: RHS repeat-associated core domain-containing protein, partial [Streptosporangiaceae bacterium]
GGLGADQQAAAAATAAHAATPSISHRDSLGRPFLTIAHNRFTPADTVPGTPATEEHYATRIAFDLQGNQLAIRDTSDRIMVRGDHDLLGNRIHQVSMEAGERWTLNDVTGQPIHTFNSRGHHVRTEYDALRRPVRSFVQGAAADPAVEILFAKTEYGEGQPNDTALNLRTRLVRQYDSAGVVTNLAFDFKGNLLQTSRQLASDPTGVIDWSASPALEAETFTSTSAYDALNRPIAITTPDASRYRPQFNEANLLERIDVDVHGTGATVNLVSDIAYDAKGQRTRIAYGNATTTDYSYDPLTFRLVGLTTTRTSEQRTLQDLAYTFDAVGNVIRIGDAAQQTIYFNNQVVTADCQYVYDAAYRLIHAEGREHIGQALQPQTTWDDASRVQLPQPGDGQAMRRYREDYRYDAVGNFLALVHQATAGNWTRNYTYNETSAIEPTRISNRLTSTTVGTDPSETYSYDAQGNVTSQPHLTLMRWDFRDQLTATARQVVDTGTPETTYYVYDVAGRRTRKVKQRQNGTRRNERIYLDGYEIYREYGGDGTTVTMQRDTLHVMDDSQRIALIEIQTVAGGVPQPAAAPVIRYQYSNHLGSAALELDGNGAVISYEEYYPYGSTSYQGMSSAPEVSLKRYRHTAMERDSETGFNYHTARYYLPWLGRWLSPDSGGLRAGLNLYGYCLSNPISSVDLNGREPQSVSIGHAGDPDLPSPATAKRADLVRYAAKHGFDYTGPDPTPDQFHMT